MEFFRRSFPSVLFVVATVNQSVERSVELRSKSCLDNHAS